MQLSFDIISDLRLEEGDKFDWTGKPTSLYCIVAGNVSSNMAIVHEFLMHLNKMYMGVFYIGGTLEYDNPLKARLRHNEISRICRNVSSSIHLHNHVVIVDGIAIVGLHGWSGLPKSDVFNDLTGDVIVDKLRQSEFIYLKNTIERLQLHVDVRKIIIVSNTVPSSELYFGQAPQSTLEEEPLMTVLEHDTDNKVIYWVYGNIDMNTEIEQDGVTYVNNSRFDKTPYWPKRIEVNI